MNSFITTTTNSVDGYKAQKYLTPISVNIVVGANVLSDIAASFTDFFGGRSNSYEKRLQDIYQQAIINLKDKAQGKGANCILGLKIDIGEVSGKGSQMFMITALGTPAIIVPIDKEQVSYNNGDNQLVSGELVADKLRAKSIVKSFVDSGNDPDRLKRKDIEFIKQSRLPEFSDMVFALLNLEKLPMEELVKQALKDIHTYFGYLSPEVASQLLYSELHKDVSASERSNVTNIIIQYGFIDYGEALKLLKSGTHNKAKNALKILFAEKAIYDHNDLGYLRESEKLIPDTFQPTGTTETVKPRFGSAREVWVCQCGHKNDMESNYCQKCKIDHYGFYEKEPKPDKVLNKIKDRIEIIEELNTN